MLFKLVSETNPDLAVKGAAGFLQTEIVVELGVCEITALEREIIAPVTDSIRHGQIMGELVGHDVVVAVRADVCRIVTEAVGILVVVGNGKHVFLAPQSMPVETDV